MSFFSLMLGITDEKEKQLQNYFNGPLNSRSNRLLCGPCLQEYVLFKCRLFNCISVLVTFSVNES